MKIDLAQKLLIAVEYGDGTQAAIDIARDFNLSLPMAKQLQKDCLKAACE